MQRYSTTFSLGASNSKPFIPGLRGLSSRGGRSVVVRIRPEEANAPFTVEEITLKTGLVDYYRLLHVEKTANAMEIKSAYRQLQKRFHPDILGDDKGHQMSVLLNDAYTVLSNERTRELYDIDLHGSKLEEELGFTNEACSEWVPASDPGSARNTDPAESRALFVDEATCIGCKQCCWAAEKTFVLDSVWGRARVARQWADTEEHMQVALESCPVRCIHWVGRHELPVLEHVMKKITRIDVGVMQGATCRKGAQVDVFVMAESFRAKKREGHKARKGWTQAFMYSRRQEAAMRRATSSHRTGPGNFTAWIRAQLWALFGYGLDRQPAVERRPRNWQPPEEDRPTAGNKIGSESNPDDPSR